MFALVNHGRGQSHYLRECVDNGPCADFPALRARNNVLIEAATKNMYNAGCVGLMYKEYNDTHKICTMSIVLEDGQGYRDMQR